MKRKAAPKIFQVILLIDASGSYGRGLLKGITKYSHLHGPWVFYSPQKGLALPHFEELDADGVIMYDQKQNEKIKEKGLPIILIDDERLTCDFPHIITDSAALGKMAAEYFLDRGFQKFAYCGYNNKFWSRNNGLCFAQRLSKAGFSVDFYKQPESQIRYSWAYEQPFLQKWLKSLPEPVAILTCHDECGRRVIESCKIANLRVPEEIAILGGDNDEIICDLATPSLSSISLNVELTGYEAAELLHKFMLRKEKMAGQEIVVHPTHIVTRQSTNTQAIEDREVAQAVRYIREHSREPIQVCDVANNVVVSRRVLETKFRIILGHTILDEIKRVKVDQIARLLLETDLSISQITTTLKYTSTGNLCRYFQGAKGISPLAYRKKYCHK
jgi:LacI family transcriptional regulator